MIAPDLRRYDLGSSKEGFLRVRYGSGEQKEQKSSEAIDSHFWVLFHFRILVHFRVYSQFRIWLFVFLHAGVRNDSAPIQAEGKIIDVAIGIGVRCHVPGHVLELFLYRQHVGGHLERKQGRGL